MNRKGFCAHGCPLDRPCPDCIHEKTLIGGVESPEGTVQLPADVQVLVEVINKKREDKGKARFRDKDRERKPEYSKTVTSAPNAPNVYPFLGPGVPNPAWKGPRPVETAKGEALVLTESVHAISFQGVVRYRVARTPSGRVSLFQDKFETLLTKDGAIALAHLLMREAEK